MPNDEFRHQCEVRAWLKARVERGQSGKDWLRKVLADIEKRRGAAAAQRLKDDIVTQWQRGNRGEEGVWL